MRYLRRSLVTSLVLAAVATAPTRAEFYPSGQITMVGRNKDVTDLSNKTNANFSPFDALAARVFLDSRATDRVSGFLQVYASDYSGMTLYGAYIRYDHSSAFHVEAGLIPTPVGLWGPRTYADKNPLIGVPSIYQFKTALKVRGTLQTSASDILGARGTSANNPIVYDFCWNTGVHAYGSVGPFDLGGALLNGSLGSPARQITYDRPSAAGHVSYAAGPWLTIGIWGAAGPFLNPNTGPGLPDGKRVEDYNQITGGALAHAASGRWEAYAEGIVNRHEHPFLGDLESAGGYLDGRVTVAPGWYLAGRLDHLSFSRLDAVIDADQRRWDYPITKFEGGVGRRLSHKTIVKLVTQIVRYTGAPASLDEELYALQFVANL